MQDVIRKTRRYTVKNVEGEAMNKFLTIRQVAETGLINENYLRALVKEGRCPHVMSGNRVLINYEALAEQLDKESKANMREES